MSATQSVHVGPSCPLCVSTGEAPVEHKPDKGYVRSVVALGAQGGIVTVRVGKVQEWWCNAHVVAATQSPVLRGSMHAVCLLPMANPKSHGPCTVYCLVDARSGTHQGGNWVECNPVTERDAAYSAIITGAFMGAPGYTSSGALSGGASPSADPSVKVQHIFEDALNLELDRDEAGL